MDMSREDRVRHTISILFLALVAVLIATASISFFFGSTGAREFHVAVGIFSLIPFALYVGFHTHYYRLTRSKKGRWGWIAIGLFTVSSLTGMPFVLDQFPTSYVELRFVHLLSGTGFVVVLLFHCGGMVARAVRR